MFLRFTSRTNTDGGLVRYMALAHNRRVDGRIRPDVPMNLGLVDQVDVAGLRRLVASISKHFGDGDRLTDAAETGAVTAAGLLAVADARTIGSIWLLDQLWQRLQVGAAVRAATDARCRAGGHGVEPGMAKGGERGGGQGSRTVAVTIEQPVLVPMTDVERAVAVSVFTEILANWWTRHVDDGRIEHATRTGAGMIHVR